MILTPRFLVALAVLIGTNSLIAQQSFKAAEGSHWLSTQIFTSIRFFLMELSGQVLE